jgi:subtilisin-like proprotein convertase family protein
MLTIMKPSLLNVNFPDAVQVMVSLSVPIRIHTHCYLESPHVILCHWTCRSAKDHGTALYTSYRTNEHLVQSIAHGPYITTLQNED